MSNNKETSSSSPTTADDIKKIINSKSLVLEEFGANKIIAPAIKQLQSSFLAGICVGFGFTAVLVIMSLMPMANEEGYNATLYALTKYACSFIFGVSIILCCLFGASLYTGNCAGFLPCIHKRIKWRYFYYDLSITLVGNYLGTVTFAVLIFFTGLFSGRDGQWFVANDVTNRLITLGLAKVQMPWWQTICSAILCNIIIVGSIASWVLIDNKAASVIVILVLIGAFVIGNYQHVVADMYITTISWLLSTLTGAINFTAHAGELFYNCLIPAAIGNFIGGCFITWIYYSIFSGVFKRRRYDPPLTKHKTFDLTKLNSYDRKIMSISRYNQMLIDLENEYQELNDKYIEDIENVKNAYNASCKNINANTKLSVADKKQKLANALNIKDKQLKELKHNYIKAADKIKDNRKKISTKKTNTIDGSISNK